MRCWPFTLLEQVPVHSVLFCESNYDSSSFMAGYLSELAVALYHVLNTNKI